MHIKFKHNSLKAYLEKLKSINSLNTTQPNNKTIIRYKSNEAI